MKELDISLNEIGPTGFHSLCDVLPSSPLQILTCSKNFLGDDVLAYFANIISDGQSQLKRFDFSSCRLNDTGLIYLINALQGNKKISHVRLQDNFFSENVEAILLETLNKNTSLIDIVLTGNRFSHSCLQKIKKITSRNMKMIEEQEPNKLKAEIYRLRYEHQKLEQAKSLLKQQKEEIEKVRGYREELVEQMHAYKQSEEQKRENLNKYIMEQRKMIQDKELLIKQKNDKITKVFVLVNAVDGGRI